MTDDRLRYDRMVEHALRNVVREALLCAADQGLPGDHHFYLTFSTRFPGVHIPEYLRAQYPEEMTVVIQYQFYDLDVTEESVGVTLSFNNSQERIVIPLSAITTFADPSVNFALQFQALPAQTEPEEEEEGEPERALAQPSGDGEADGAAAAGQDDGSNVVTLDSFRKK
jgi:hypothetical protein